MYIKCILGQINQVQHSCVWLYSGTMVQYGRLICLWAVGEGIVGWLPKNLWSKSFADYKIFGGFVLFVMAQPLRRIYGTEYGKTLVISKQRMFPHLTMKSDRSWILQYWGKCVSAGFKNTKKTTFIRYSYWFVNGIFRIGWRVVYMSHPQSYHGARILYINIGVVLWLVRDQCKSFWNIFF